MILSKELQGLSLLLLLPFDFLLSGYMSFEPIA